MKKLITILLIALLAFTFFSCAKGECEACGKEASLQTVKVAGEEGKVCKDCAALVKLGAAMMGY